MTPSVFESKAACAMSVLLALLLASCAAQPRGAQVPSASAADAGLHGEMAEFVQRFVAGYESGDVEQMRSLYLPSAMIWAHNRPTAVGSAGIADFFAQSFSRYRAEVEAHVLDVERLGDGRAMLYTLARVDLEPKLPGLQPTTVYFRDLIVLVRGAGGWRIETNVDQPTTKDLFEADRARVPFR